MYLSDNVLMFKVMSGCKVILFALLFSATVAAEEKSDDIWIDVRSPEEYRQGHLEGAVNIPFMQIMQQITDVTKDKKATIRLYCTVGSRAKIAKHILDSMGYENVVNEGGLKDIKQ